MINRSDSLSVWLLMVINPLVWQRICTIIPFAILLEIRVNSVKIFENPQLHFSSPTQLQQFLRLLTNVMVSDVISANDN